MASDLGKYIRNRRNTKGLSMREVAELSGCSHAEIFRIESGEREYPSMRVLIALARALEIPDHDVLRLAGYTSDDDDMSMMEKVFPDLKTEKLQETAERLIDGLARNNDLQDNDYDDLVDHMEMFYNHVKKKRNTQKT